MIRPGTSQRIPFDLLFGDWIGAGIVFYTDGAYYSHAASRVRIRELRIDGVRHLRYENFSGEGAALGSRRGAPLSTDAHPLFGEVAPALVRTDYQMLFRVEGKRAVAVEHSPSIVSAVGFMSTNDTYPFVVRNTFTPRGGEPVILTLHNNHSFPSSNTRQVFGTIADPHGETILLTSFIYTSYTPPPDEDD